MQRLRTLALIVFARLKACLLLRGGLDGPRRMVLLESLPLGNRRQLFLVACDGHRFLVGASAERVGTLVAMPEVAFELASDERDMSRQGLVRPALAHRQSAPRIHAADASAAPALRLVKRRISMNAVAAAVVAGTNSERRQPAETGDSRWC